MTASMAFNCRRWLELAFIAVVFIACFLSVMFFGGCAALRYTFAARAAYLPAGTTAEQAKAWDATVANLQTIAVASSVARQTLEDENQATPLDKEYYSAFRAAVLKLSELQLSAIAVALERPHYLRISEKITLGKYATDMLGQARQLDSLGVAKIRNVGAAKHMTELVGQLLTATRANALLTQ